jgi:DNA-binding NarL/FixJ family response regulator
VVIADDHALARAGLRSLLHGERVLEVVGEAASGQEAVLLCERLQPDLILLDVRMPDMDGLSVSRAIKRDLPSVCVVIVSLDSSPGTLIEAVRSGADAYILKGSPRRELLAVIREVLHGETSIHPALADWLLDLLPADGVGAAVPVALSLDPTERKALALRAAGASPAAIAKRLKLSSREVSALFEHLRVRLREVVADGSASSERRGPRPGEVREEAG